MVNSTKRPLAELYKRDNGICWKCKRKITLEEASRDHIIPRSMGGVNHQSNLKLACKKCNANRSNTINDDALMEAFEKRLSEPRWKIPRYYRPKKVRLSPKRSGADTTWLPEENK